MRKLYFCGCGEPIEKDELMCIGCELYWQNKYKDDTYYTWYMTDELKRKYIKE